MGNLLPHSVPLDRPAVVLVQPRIAENVGAIGRLCSVCHAHLAIVRPIPFSLTERSLARAGMDYWQQLSWSDHESWGDVESALAGRDLWFLETPAPRSLYQAPLRLDSVLVFGSETAGLPQELRSRFADRLVHLPQRNASARSLNLAQTAAVALFELLRQSGFPPA